MSAAQGKASNRTDMERFSPQRTGVRNAGVMESQPRETGAPSVTMPSCDIKLRQTGIYYIII